MQPLSVYPSEPESTDPHGSLQQPMLDPSTSSLPAAGQIIDLAASQPPGAKLPANGEQKSWSGGVQAGGTLPLSRPFRLSANEMLVADGVLSLLVWLQYYALRIPISGLFEPQHFSEVRMHGIGEVGVKSTWVAHPSNNAILFGSFSA